MVYIARHHKNLLPNLIFSKADHASFQIRQILTYNRTFVIRIHNSFEFLSILQGLLLIKKVPSKAGTRTNSFNKTIDKKGHPNQYQQKFPNVIFLIVKNLKPAQNLHMS